MLSYVAVQLIVGISWMRGFYWPSEPVLASSKFPTANIAAVRLPRDSIANVWALPLTSILSFSLPLSGCCFLSHYDHSRINNLESTSKSSDTAVQCHFPRSRTSTPLRIHTSLHSIAIICSYGYIKKYVHQGGNLRYEIVSPFAKVRKLWAEHFPHRFLSQVW